MHISGLDEYFPQAIANLHMHLVDEGACSLCIRLEDTMSVIGLFFVYCWKTYAKVKFHPCVCVTG